MITVKATREGLVGQRTASGFMIDTVVPFVALPSTSALHWIVRVRNPLNSKTCLAVVLDIGPWNVHDDAYVLHGERPASERGESVSALSKTNDAGIDLGEYVWKALGMLDNGNVEWERVI